MLNYQIIIFMTTLCHFTKKFKVFLSKRLEDASSKQTKIIQTLSYILVSYFLTGRNSVLKLSAYSSDVRSYLQKKFHGNLAWLQMSATTFKTG